MSGMCAAISAARGGAKTALVHARHVLGGNASSEVRMHICGASESMAKPMLEESGLVYEIMLDNKAINDYYNFSIWDMVLFRAVKKEPNLTTYLNTAMEDCELVGGRIAKITAYQQTTETKWIIGGKLFIDCTGNADVAAAAGVPCWKGDEESGVPQPGTLMFEVDGVSDEAYVERPQRPVKAYRTPVRGRYKVNHFRVFDTDATDSRSMTRAHMEARRQVLDAYRILREETPGFERAELTQVASVLGVRESRHIEGRYKITVEDIAQGTKFEDRIAAYAFGMDVHPRSPEMTGNFKIQSANVYYVPYRSLLPIGCDNLLVAGKTISCQSQAAGGLRVMPCAMTMGQAAGAAASIAWREGIDLGDVPTETLQGTLRAHGVILD